MTGKALKITRELWLERAVDMFRPRFIEVGAPLPATIHVSVGFAFGARKENNRIPGQCWKTTASDDGVNHVFVSPEMGDTLHVLETLLHELVHVSDDCTSGHRGWFAEVATRLGLLAPMTVTPASPDVQAELIVMAAELGHYPHGALHTEPVAAPVGPDGQEAPATKQHSGPAKQRTRMHKVVCAHCGYTVRTTTRWLDVGMPRCPEGFEMIAE